MSRVQVDGAIQHYIEAGAFASAVNAALESKQIVRAAQLVSDSMRDPATARPFYLQIARHYQGTNALEEAEKFYVKAGEPAQAVDMYIAVGRWESSYAIARQVPFPWSAQPVQPPVNDPCFVVVRFDVQCMSEEAVGTMYIKQAQRMEREGDLRLAERLYLIIDEADLAINMYKKARQYDNMVRLVKSHRPDLLKETYLHLAQQQEMEGNLKVGHARVTLLFHELIQLCASTGR